MAGRYSWTSRSLRLPCWVCRECTNDGRRRVRRTTEPRTFGCDSTWYEWPGANRHTDPRGGDFCIEETIEQKTKTKLYAQYDFGSFHRESGRSISNINVQFLLFRRFLCNSRPECSFTITCFLFSFFRVSSFILPFQL